MNHISPRLREAALDGAIAGLLRTDEAAAIRFLSTLPEAIRSPIAAIAQQVPHVGTTGSIDLELRLAGGARLLCENKIDAGWSVNSAGEAQPERYRQSVARLRATGVEAVSVLIAPEIYLGGSTRRTAFDHAISYETLARDGSGPEIDLLRAAIVQAASPYEPEPNALTGDFFAAYAALAAHEFPGLTVKRNPNDSGVRPTASRTIYFDAKRILCAHADVPLPRISVQAWDSGATSASAKLMIGGWGRMAAKLARPDSLFASDAYLRPAGRSLGIVIDTPRLDTQAPLAPQVEAVRAGLSAVETLTDWWNGNGATLVAWARAAGSPS